MPSPSICRVIEDAKYQAREKRASRDKPPPWIAVKLMVPITVGIMVYAAYVYIGRLCVPAIRRHSEVLSRGGAIGLLIVFCLLFVWMMWAYAVVILTPPGFARDHVPKSAQPQAGRPPPIVPTNADLESGSMNNPARLSGTTHMESIGGPSYEDLALRNALETATSRHESDVPPPPPLDDKQLELRLKMASINLERKPPLTPVLLPEYRYCPKDEIVKPYRSHHCRICGTCVLKFDHHCPWIGQCVGARNHKFFINFNQATVVFTAYTFGTLLAYTIRSSDVADDLDVQHIVIIALSALFLTFTFMLTVSHIRLLFLSESTVESMRDHSMKERESHHLNGALGFCNIRKKQQIQKAWDQEWGRIGKEGNLWWLESGRKGWEDTMGSWWVGWIFPVGRGLSDGLHYTPNPRFTKEGIWRRRKDWPVELR